MTDRLGTSLGQYKIERLLGEGGMASVYAARHLPTDREVAIKITQPHLAEIEEYARRFEREVRISNALDHPHILKVYDYGRQNSIVYLVTEYIAGGNLADVMDQGPMPLSQARSVLEQISSALNYIHQLGIIHRDLKPQNILLDESGNAYLSDFGIAKVLDEVSDLTQSGAPLGSPTYMPPETWEGSAADARADIYSLGIRLYEMLAGTAPFHGESFVDMMEQHLYAIPVPIHDIRPEIPVAVDTVVDKALDKYRELRFSSAREFLAAFDQAVGHQASAPVLPANNLAPPALPISSAQPALAQAPRKSCVTLALNGVALLAVLVLGVVIVSQLLDRRNILPFLNTSRNVTAPAVPMAATTMPTLTTLPPETVGTIGTPLAATITLTESPATNPLPLPITATTRSTIAQTVTPTREAARTNTARPATLKIQPPLTLGPGLSVEPIGGKSVIAFSSDRDGGHNDIYLSDVDGNNVRRLTNEQANAYGSSWSPDGQFIAFTSYRDGNFEIYTMTADGEDLRNLTHNPAQDFDPAWSPDGKTIAFVSWRTGNREIFVMDSDGGNPHALTNNPATDWFPAWSPDGKSITFTSDRDGNYDIYIMDADGQNQRNLTNYPADDRFTAWSPDGRQIAFNSNRNGNFEVYVMDADGKNARNLTRSPGDDLFASWSPDGKSIAFTSNRSGKQAIYVMGADGQDVRRLTNGASNNFYPAWQPKSR